MITLITAKVTVPGGDVLRITLQGTGKLQLEACSTQLQPRMRQGNFKAPLQVTQHTFKSNLSQMLKYGLCCKRWKN